MSSATISDFYPESEWWRLYINPVDHARALQLCPDNPGFLYDIGASPGYQRSMLDAYRQVLDSAPRKIDADVYDEYFAYVSGRLRSDGTYDDSNCLLPAGTYGEDGSLGRRPGVHLGVNYDRLSDEMKHEKIAHWCLVHDGEYAAGVADVALAAVDSSRTDGELVLYSPGRSPDDARLIVDAIMERYYRQLGSGKSDILTAAGLAVRALMIAHLFADMNGRLNIQVVLPRLLLDHGLRPATPTFMAKVFSGGLSIAEIRQHIEAAMLSEPGKLAFPKSFVGYIDRVSDASKRAARGVRI
jgi:hypothetical protein